MNWGSANSSQTPFCHREGGDESGGFQFIRGKLPQVTAGHAPTGILEAPTLTRRASERAPGKNALLPRWRFGLVADYPNRSITGLPVVRGRKMPLLFCGSLRGTPRAW